jgi:hypothetical protein
VRYTITIAGPADGPSAAVEAVEAWLDAPAIRTLVEADGGTWPTDPLVDRLKQLNEFSQRWDFRGGAERLAISDAALEIDDDLVLQCGSTLGMTTASSPSRKEYDHALVLGGTALASVYRVRYLNDLIKTGIAVHHVAALTAMRELPEAELDIARARPDVAPLVDGAQVEFDVLLASVADLVGEVPIVERVSDPNPHLAGAVGRVGSTATVIAAPSADPARRANTVDNYAAYSEQIEPGDHLLVVTSSIYLPYQFFLAVKTALDLRPPLTIEAVGFPPEWLQGILSGPKNVLQELRSGFFGAQTLVEAARARSTA